MRRVGSRERGQGRAARASMDAARAATAPTPTVGCMEAWRELNGEVDMGIPRLAATRWATSVRLDSR